MAQKDNTKCS